MQKHTHTQTHRRSLTCADLHAQRKKEAWRYHHQSRSLKGSHVSSPQDTVGREEVGRPQAPPTSAVKMQKSKPGLPRGNLEARRRLSVFLRSQSRSGQN